MLDRIRSKFSKQPEYVNPFADFVINASAREKKKVFEQVMREATEKQRKTMERARAAKEEAERKEAQTKVSRTEIPGSASDRL